MEDHPYCSSCDPKTGHCSVCNAPLCWVHLEEAHNERNGVCSLCANPGVKPDEPDAVVHSWAEKNALRARKRETNAQVLREKQCGLRKFNQHDKRGVKGDGA